VASASEALRSIWQGLAQLTPELVVSLVIVVLTWLVGRGIGRLVLSLLTRGRMREIQRQFFRRVVTWAVYLVGFVLILNVLGLRTAAAGLAAGGGITAIILGFAFRQIGENFIAGMFLAFGSPFKVGDLIESGGQKGIVQSIELRSTHIRTADGRDIFIPNAQILNEPLINFTRDGFLRPTFTIGVDYGDDVLAACRLLSEEVSKVESVREDPSPLVTVHAFEDAWVEIEVAFWIDVFEQGVSLPEVRSVAMDRCRRALLEAGFTVSSDTTTAVSLASRQPIEVRVDGLKSAV
jgi:small-conductance mechanosensitive channel